MKNSYRAVENPSGMALTALLCALAVGQARALDAVALPTGGSIAAGTGTISQNGAEMRVDQATQNLVVDWNSFDIGSAAHVHFAQPSAAAIALNRVLAGDASQIFGRLSADGRVFLVNPNGILFGATARVDVGGLVASTLDISDADFLAGRHVFAGGGLGGVVNRGEIRAADQGYVVLLAPEVRNEGVIVARLGTVALAAGNKVSLDTGGDGLVKVVIDAAAVAALAANQGLIRADGGLVYLGAKGAGDLAATVVNNAGVIEACGLVEREGRILLLGGEDAGIVANSGTLDVSSATGKGGGVRVLGAKVGLFDGTRIDASGASGGGEVLIGGDFQGRNPDVANSSRTYVGKDARIKADATVEGDGGRVIVWADDVTRYYGSISVQGGTQGGDGGFVEVSGEGSLGFHGSVDTRSPQGRMGTLLLDPLNIIIATGGGDDLIGAVGNDGNDHTYAFAEDPGATASIAPGTLTGLLSSGNVVLQASNDITVNSVVSWNNASSLTLTAGNNVAVNALINNFGSGSINLTATGGSITADIAGGGDAIHSGNGSIRLIAGQDIVLGGAGGYSDINTGAGVVQTIDLEAGRDVILDNASYVASDGGAIRVTAGRNIELKRTGSGGATIGSGWVGAAGGNVTLRAGQNIEMATTTRVLANRGDIIDMTATAGHVTVFNVQSVAQVGTSGVVNITAGTSIDNTVGTGNDTANVIGTNIGLRAGAGGIGQTSGALDVDARGRLDADTSAAGAAIAIDDVSGNLPLGAINAGGGSVTLASKAGMSDAGGDALVNVTAGTATFNAVSGIGAAGVNAGIETIATTVNAVNSTSGGVFINSLGGTAAGVGAASFANIAANTAGNVELRAATDLVIPVGGAIRGNAAGDTVVLSTAANFINNAGAGAVVATGGRWLIYSASPLADTFGGLNSGNNAVWGATYPSTPPAGVAQAGNRYLFAYQPTVSFRGGTLSKVQGADANAALALYLTGWSDDAATYYSGNGAGIAFTQDTFANAFTGVPAVTSPGAGAAAAAGTYAIVLGPGTLASSNGNLIAFVNGTLTVLGGSAVNNYAQTLAFLDTEFTGGGLRLLPAHADCRCSATLWSEQPCRIYAWALPDEPHPEEAPCPIGPLAPLIGMVDSGIRLPEGVGGH